MDIDVSALIKLKRLKRKETGGKSKNWTSLFENLREFLYLSEDAVWGLATTNSLNLDEKVYEKIDKEQLKTIEGREEKIYVTKIKNNSFGFSKTKVDKFLKLFKQNEIYFPKLEAPLVIKLENGSIPTLISKNELCVVISPMIF